MVTAAGFGTSEIPVRMGDNFRAVVCLEMTEKYAYTEALRTQHLGVLPEENVKGRGLAKVGSSILEYQTALAIQAEDDFKRGETIKELCMRMNQAWKGKSARRIPAIPEKPVWKEYCKLDEVTGMISEGYMMPIGYDQKNATIYGIDLRRTYCYLVSGKARTGKTNVLRIMILAAQMIGGQIAVIDFDGDLKAFADLAGAKYISTNQELFDYWSSISDTFKSRNVKKRSYVADGYSDEEIYERMQEFEKIFIFIGSLPDFVTHVHNPGEGIGVMAPFVTTLLEKGAMHNVYWFAGFNQDEVSKAVGFDVYNSFIKYKRGIHLGGNVAAQRLLPFDYVPYTEQTKVFKPGVGMLPVDEENDTAKVVIPLYKAD